MVAQMSVLEMAYAILALLTLLAALFSPWHLVTALVLIVLFVLLTVGIPLHLAWSRSNFGFLVIAFTMSILYGVFIFALIYYRTGLLVSGSLTSVSFAEALYFSVTTWATLGYGDYTAPRQYQLVTSVEALTGYFAMGVFMALVALWLSEALRAYDEYVKRLPDLAKQAAKELAAKTPSLAEKLKPLVDEKRGDV